MSSQSVCGPRNIKSGFMIRLAIPVYSCDLTLNTMLNYQTKQLSFNYSSPPSTPGSNYIDSLVELLSEELNFHDSSSNYATHNFHSFPAKFPPQLPLKFILALTEPGDVVIDPMMGSGTTVVEAFLTGRQGVGFDIDPLAVSITRVKTTPLNENMLADISMAVLQNARDRVQKGKDDLERMLKDRWDAKTRQFIDYWFEQEVQIELMALLSEISRIDNASVRTFLEVAFSSIIITKSGGVSLALDLAHTRPHKAKKVISKDGSVILGEELDEETLPRLGILTKKLRSPIEDFDKRCRQNIQCLFRTPQGKLKPAISFGNAQKLPLEGESADLIFTSPPYASNAIDYMRAHKFSLVWLGYPLDDLGLKRKEYIGGEVTTNLDYESLPPLTARIVTDLSGIDPKRGRVLHRYYSEMTRTLQEMYRVLKSGKAAIVVVGNSVMRGVDTQIPDCLSEIGREIGFEVPKIGVRRLNRNKRMMPAGHTVDKDSRIQKRMHEEYVIGFHKP